MDWKSFIKETRSKFANLNKELPNTFDGFNLMGKDAKKNGIVDENKHHILFVFRGHRHRITTRANFLNPGDFVTFILKSKYNSLIPIKIKTTFSTNRNTFGYSTM